MILEFESETHTLLRFTTVKPVYFFFTDCSLSYVKLLTEREYESWCAYNWYNSIMPYA
jgi:hypothetical protein